MKDDQVETASKKKAARRASAPRAKKPSAAFRSPATPRSAKAAPSTKPAKPKVRDRARRVETITEEQRRSMIAERAYFKAERRGFAGGDALQDWCEAEAEIDALILRGPEGES